MIPACVQTALYRFSDAMLPNPRNTSPTILADHPRLASPTSPAPRGLRQHLRAHPPPSGLEASNFRLEA